MLFLLEEETKWDLHDFQNFILTELKSVICIFSCWTFDKQHLNITTMSKYTAKTKVSDWISPEKKLQRSMYSV
jgi:hypothetical protein